MISTRLPDRYQYLKRDSIQNQNRKLTQSAITNDSHSLFFADSGHHAPELNSTHTLLRPLPTIPSKSIQINNPALHRKVQRQRMLSNSSRILRRHIGHRDARSFRGRRINLVSASPERRQQAEIWGRGKFGSCDTGRGCYY